MTGDFSAAVPASPEGAGGGSPPSPGAAEETENQRLNRNMNELLQELRVAQTGVQVLFAFLLALAFTDRFADVDDVARGIYVATLLCAVAATGFLVAPVGFHRMLFRRRMKKELVATANRQAIAGLLFLAFALSGALLLILDVVFGRGVAALVGGLTLAWLLMLWFGLPYLRARGLRRTD